jgi:hypothetical protein
VVGCDMGPGPTADPRGQGQLRTRYAPRPAPGAFVFVGNAIANDGDGHVFTASPPTTPYETANLGYRGGKWQPLGTGLWG